MPNLTSVDVTAGVPTSGTGTVSTIDALMAMVATQATSAAILAKLSADPATQTTLAAVLAKIIAAPATEAKQDTGNTSLASIAALLVTQAGFLDGIEGLLAAATPAGTNVIGKVDHTSTGIGHGKKTVTTAGTDVAIAASTAAKWVTVQAYRANTGYISVGASGVDAVAAGDGVQLSAGESITLPIDNLADVFVDATVNGEGVRFTYGT